MEVIKLSNSTGYDHAVHQDFLASKYSARGKYKKAIAIRQELHEQFVVTLGKSNFETLNVLRNLQEDHYRARNFAKVQELAQMSVDIALETLGEGHEVIIQATAQLEMIY